MQFFFSEMKFHRISPNARTLENFLIYYCNKKDIDKAVSFLESKSEENLLLNSKIASALIYCHCSRNIFIYFSLT